MILLPLAVHGYSLGSSIFGDDGLYLGVGSAVSAIVFLTIVVYWAGSRFYSLGTLHPVVAPVAVVASILPAVFPATHPLPNTDAPAFKFHLLIALLAYSLFTIAALHALFMALVEKRLHQAARSAVLSDFPPLLTMERLLFRIIGAGFVLLTLTLASGIVFSEEVFGKPIQFNHKTVFGLVSWAVYAALLGGRWLYGWRGRVAIRWTLAGFAALLLAYVGSKFVLEVILRR
ncbi:cytochrome c biogenesis protein CcsA [Pelomicrobium methylotrophicum]|uniref:cytochrome c biogenesis protein CcsA n=1 Tax=Pelomicrobium methylotrophicum TaxID=2602750 RepID=UPI00196A0B64